MSLHTGSPGRLRVFRARRGVRLAVARFRPLVLTAVAAVTVALVIPLLRPTPAATVPVLVAARDLAAGSRLAPDDVTVARWPVGARPDGALTRSAALDQGVLAAAMRRGEPLTDARLLGSGLLGAGLIRPGLLAEAGEEMVAAPVRIADASAAGIVRVGDVIDLYLVIDPAAAGGALLLTEVTTPTLDTHPRRRAGSDVPAVPGGRPLAAAVRVLAKLDGTESSGSGGSLSGGSGGSLVGGAGSVGGAMLVVAADSGTAARLAGSSGTPIALVLRAKG